MAEKINEDDEPITSTEILAAFVGAGATLNAIQVSAYQNGKRRFGLMGKSFKEAIQLAKQNVKKIEAELDSIFL